MTTHKEQSMIDNRVACPSAGYPAGEARWECDQCYWEEKDGSCKYAECNFMHKRGNFRGANPSFWFPRKEGSNKCQICGKEINDIPSANRNEAKLRIIHGPGLVEEGGGDHLDVCETCFYYAPELEGWFACGCGG